MTQFQNKTILVTGCAGFIPSHVTESLLEKGAFVIGIDDLSTGNTVNMKSFRSHERFRFVEGDVNDTKLLEKHLQYADYLYHGAIRGIGVSLKDPIEELKVNTESTLNLLELLRKHPVTRFVYPSSASVYGEPHTFPEKEEDLLKPLSPYGVSKLAAERYCLAYHAMYDIPVVCLRYFNTYGPRQRADSLYGGVISILLQKAVESKPMPIYGDGSQTRDFTYVADTVQATINAFTAKDVDGEVVNVAAGKEYSILEIAQLIKTVTQSESTIQYTKARKVDNISRRWADIKKAQGLLDYTPQTDIVTGLTKTYESLINVQE